MTELFPFEDPRRRCLRVAEWPEADRLAWESAMRPGDILDGTVGPGFHWSSETRKKYRKGYGRWLTFLIMSARFDPDQIAGERVTPDAVRAYIEDLDDTVSSWTLWGRLAELLAAIKVIDLEHDWTWLRRVVRFYESKVVDSRNKLQRLRAPDQIVTWAYRRMDEIQHDPPKRDSEVAYRDALMVALLIQCPTMRLRNLTMIQLGKHLLSMETDYHLSFGRDETKTGNPISIPVPESLASYVDHYLEVVRPILLQGTDCDRLWITKNAKPMREKAIYSAIARTTERAFGVSINPHLFRDCAANFVAISDPKHVGIAAPILGHTDPRTTERHYIQANQIEAGRRLRHSVDRLRTTLPNSPINHRREN